ncbi:hypothetical protein [Streptomyces sp. GC420]|uniref:hypothetical protein n=1 Tax=Streptomyces sp. GC420 TaxID=2697568 RepID=UPI0014150E86|nr:hypothetical protein [Streptomyces sp. GC420]NBM14936.1 hypothetical protein [Streptomyces sp. GC420]
MIRIRGLSVRRQPIERPMERLMALEASDALLPPPHHLTEVMASSDGWRSVVARLAQPNSGRAWPAPQKAQL